MAKMKYLSESKASELAHSLGLDYEGYGYWSLNGEIVARTQNNELVKIDKSKMGGDLDYLNFNPDDQKSNPEAYASSDWDFAHDPYDGQVKPGSSTVGDKDNIMHQQDGQATGTSAGGFYTGKDGVKRYVKIYQSPHKAVGEVLANSLYRDLDIAAPESQYFDVGDGTVGFASTLVDHSGEILDYASHASQHNLTDSIPTYIADKILDGFAADCLTANWDVVGSVHEGYLRNVVVSPDGEPIRIDQGGAFLNRGLDAKLNGMKPESVLNQLGEWNVFPTANPGYQTVFRSAGMKSADDIGKKRMSKQVKGIINLHNKKGGWGKYVDEIIPDAAPDAKKKMTEMLYHRTKILVDKVANWNGPE